VNENEFSIKRWLDELPDEEIEREMAELNEEIQTLSARINTLRGALELKQRFRNLYEFHPDSGRIVIAADPPTVTIGPGAEGEPRPSSISKSVLLLMESNPEKREWSVKDLQGGLVKRGWLDDTTQAFRSLGAALSRMTADGEIRRASRGLYASVSHGAASPSLLDSEGGEPG
jgi:hypothetical protein